MTKYELNKPIKGTKCWKKTDPGAEWRSEETLYDHKNGDRIRIWHPYSFEWKKKVNKLGFIPNFQKLGDIHRVKTIFVGTKGQAEIEAKKYMKKHDKC
ncbi:MAG: hypothetical protein AABY22_23465 [Nanoarchaeota archaeon]